MRVLRLLLCLGCCVALAGCAGAVATQDIAPATASAPSAAADPAPDDGMKARAHAPAATPSAAPARGRAAAKRPKDEAKSKDDGKDEWWKDGPVTREKIAAMCWMKFEKGRNDLPLEKRADLVNACVDETLKQHPAR
jgi:hypothetical protein